MDPIWRKAPLLLARFPQILVAVLAGAAILTATAAARPAYLASSARAALAGEIKDFSRWNAGLRVTRHGSLAEPLMVIEGGDPFRQVPSELDLRAVPLPQAVEDVRKRLARIVRRVDSLQAPVLLMAGSPLRVGNTGNSADAQGRLVYRDDWGDHVEIVRRTRGRGVWISDVTARQIGVDLGDAVVLRVGRRSHSARVVALYRHLALDRPRDAWASASDMIYKDASADTYPPPFVLAPRDVFFAATSTLGDSGQVQWNVPVRRGELSLEEAETLSRAISHIIATHLSDYNSELVQAIGVGFLPNERSRSSAMQAVVSAARAQIGALRAPIDVLSIAATGVAAAVLIAAGYYLVQRRRVEFASLVQRGLSPARLAARAGTEMVLPGVAGGLLGLIVGLATAGALGPGRGLPREAAGDALLASVIAIAVGITLASAAVFLASRREETRWGRARSPRLRGTWEMAAGMISIFVVWRLWQADIELVGGRQSNIRLDVLLLPLLAVLATGGLTMRATQAVLSAARTTARRWPPALYLAARRLANSSGTTVALVSACAFSFAVFTYATMVAASTQQTAHAKAHVYAGSDTAALVAPAFEDVDLAVPSTYVVRFKRFFYENGTNTVPVIGVDPQTFARVAYWESRFSQRSLADLIAALDGSGDEFRVISVGGAPLPQTDEIGMDVRLVGRATVFPGQVGDDPLLVTSTDSLLRALAGEASAVGRADELWMEGDAERTAAVLAEAEVPYYSLRSAGAVLETPSLQALSWTLRLVRALGMGAVVLSILGLLLYLQARERATAITVALTARMGLSRRAHLMMLITENASLLGLALLSGIAAGGAIVIALLPRFDLLPGLPPSPVLEVPIGPLAAIVIAGIALAAAGAIFARWATSRRDIVEVLRS